MSFCRQTAVLIRRCVIQNQLNIAATQKRNIKRWVAPTIKAINRRKAKVEVVESPRNQFLEWNYEAELFAFGKRLGEDFNRKLLKQALIQKEYANLEEENAKKEGKPAELVGDNLELSNEGARIISNYIRDEYRKTLPEDLVEAVHRYLTSEDMLAHVAKHMGLTDLILTTEYPVEKTTLSTVFKAVVTALKQSTDLERAQLFVKDFVLSQMNEKDVYEIWDPERPYEYLSDLLKQKGITAAEPRLCNSSGVNTILANYQVGLYSDKKLLGIGWGETIETAKDTAALDAIQKIYNIKS